MRAQLQLQEGGEEDGSDEEDEEDEGQERWGSRKGAYYASAEVRDVLKKQSSCSRRQTCCVPRTLCPVVMSSPSLSASFLSNNCNALTG